MKSSATIPTSHAFGYLVQLCLHFADQVPADFEGRHGRIRFETGEAALRASPETLILVGRAETAEGLADLEQTIASHLKRFALSEPNLVVDWRRAPAGAVQSALVK
jgi:hypothetical protein